MYGNLIQLNSDLTDGITWQRLPLSPVEGGGAIDEVRLQAGSGFGLRLWKPPSFVSRIARI